MKRCSITIKNVLSLKKLSSLWVNSRKSLKMEQSNKQQDHGEPLVHVILHIGCSQTCSNILPVLQDNLTTWWFLETLCRIQSGHTLLKLIHSWSATFLIQFVRFSQQLQSILQLEIMKECLLISEKWLQFLSMITWFFSSIAPHFTPKKYHMDWLYKTMSDSWKGWIPEDQEKTLE